MMETNNTTESAAAEQEPVHRVLARVLAGADAPLEAVEEVAGQVLATALKLPSWARLAVDRDARIAVRVEIDGPKAYGAWIDTLKEKYKGVEGVEVQLDQYWLEVAYQCIKLDVQLAIAGSPVDARVSGKLLQFHISRALGYELANHPPGLGAEMASKGKHARKHFSRVRGREAFLRASA